MITAKDYHTILKQQLRPVATMNLNDYREDLKLQDKGAPVYVGDAIFYVKRIGTPAAQAFIKELKLSLWGPFSNHAEQDANELLAHWLVEYGVTGWDNVQDESGADLPYTQLAARKVFLNKEYWLSLNAILTNAASTFEHYLHEQAEVDAEAVKKS